MRPGHWIGAYPRSGQAGKAITGNSVIARKGEREQRAVPREPVHGRHGTRINKMPSHGMQFLNARVVHNPSEVVQMKVILKGVEIDEPGRQDNQPDMNNPSVHGWLPFPAL